MTQSATALGSKTSPNKVASTAAIATAIASAPCFISLLLLPLGITVGMSSALYIFLDKYRLFAMGISIISVGLMHWALRKGTHFKPTKTVWVITIIVALFVVGELVADPPWARHLIIMRLEG